MGKSNISTIGAILATIIAIAVSLWLGYTSHQAIGKLGTTLGGIDKTLTEQRGTLQETGKVLTAITITLGSQGTTLGAIDKTLAEQGTILRETVKNVEKVTMGITGVLDKLKKMDEIQYVLGKITSRSWVDYLDKGQTEAFFNNPGYIKLSEKQNQKYDLTPQGLELLLPQWQQAIVETLKANNHLPNNELILKLDVRDLCNAAFDRKISPQILLGTLTTFIDLRRAL